MIRLLCRGYVGPGGLETGGRFSKCTGGAAQLVDVAVFGSRHIYQRPTAAAVYDTSVPFDPEGTVFFFPNNFTTE